MFFLTEEFAPWYLNIDPIFSLFLFLPPLLYTFYTFSYHIFLSFLFYFILYSLFYTYLFLLYSLLFVLYLSFFICFLSFLFYSNLPFLFHTYLFLLYSLFFVLYLSFFICFISPLFYSILYSTRISFYLLCSFSHYTIVSYTLTFSETFLFMLLFFPPLNFFSNFLLSFTIYIFLSKFSFYFAFLSTLFPFVFSIFSSSLDSFSPFSIIQTT